MLVTDVWSKQPGKWFCIATLKKAGRLRKSEKEQPKIYWFERHRFDRVPDKVEELKGQKLNVYFCPHGFKQKGNRKKDNAVAPRLLYADLDETRPNSCKIEPSWAIESSPGRYVGLWLTDEVITERDNQSWTYYIGADKTGWDFGQILRVPGTRNYKYDDAPRVRSVGGTRKAVKLAEIRKLVPQRINDLEGKNDRAVRVYQKYEKILPVAVRRELLAKSTGREDRSKVLWRLNNLMHEAGIPQRAIYLLLRNSVWNKFLDRPDGDSQLKKELAKALTKKVGVKRPDDKPKLFAQSMAEVEEEEFDWLWYPYLARGEVTIFEGRPGVGKSWLAQMTAAHLCDGKKIPSDSVVKRKPCKVFFLDHENSKSTVMKKRLVANGCVNLGNFFQEEMPMSVNDEDAMENLYGAIEDACPDLLVFDTLTNYLGGVRGFSPAETAQLMMTFRDIAMRFKIAVLIVRHINKGKQDVAQDSGQGATVISGMARCVVTVGYSPDDPYERVYAVNKLNIAEFPQSRTFYLKPQDKVARFEWGRKVDLSADEVVGVLKPKAEEDTSLTEWLTTFLEENVGATKEEVMTSADKKGYTSQQVERVAGKIGVVKKPKGFGKKKRIEWLIP